MKNNKFYMNHSEKLNLPVDPPDNFFFFLGSGFLSITGTVFLKRVLLFLEWIFSYPLKKYVKTNKILELKLRTLRAEEV